MFKIIPNFDTAPLDVLLMDGLGLLRPIEAWKIQSIPKEELLSWMHKRAVYQIPTVELIDWLHEQTKSTPTIEICAGNGAIARALGITATDSYVQVNEAKSLLLSMGQCPTEPPADVLRYEANKAIEAFRPDTVIGSFVTQKWCDATQQGSIWGVDEEKLLSKVGRYIMIGNEAVHGHKRILKYPHKKLHFPWLVSRGFDQSKNCIYVWG